MLLHDIGSQDFCPGKIIILSFCSGNDVCKAFRTEGN